MTELFAYPGKNYFVLTPLRQIQWKPSNTDTLGTKIIVLISEVSLFQGENNMYLYKVGTQPGVLIKQGVLKERFNCSSEL